MGLQCSPWGWRTHSLNLSLYLSPILSLSPMGQLVKARQEPKNLKTQKSRQITWKYGTKTNFFYFFISKSPRLSRARFLFELCCPCLYVAIPYKLPHNLSRAVDGGHARVCARAIAHGSVTSLPMGQLVKAPWVPKNKIWTNHMKIWH